MSRDIEHELHETLARAAAAAPTWADPAGRVRTAARRDRRARFTVAASAVAVSAVAVVAVAVAPVGEGARPKPPASGETGDPLREVRRLSLPDGAVARAVTVGPDYVSVIVTVRGEGPQGDAFLYRFKRATGQSAAEPEQVGSSVVGIASARTAQWVLRNENGRGVVQAYDVEDQVTARVDLDSTAYEIASANDAVWVATADAVVRITEAGVQRIPLPVIGMRTSISATSAQVAVLVSRGSEGELLIYDAVGLKLLARKTVGDEPHAVATDHATGRTFVATAKGIVRFDGVLSLSGPVDTPLLRGSIVAVDNNAVWAATGLIMVLPGGDTVWRRPFPYGKPVGIAVLGPNAWVAAGEYVGQWTISAARKAPATAGRPERFSLPTHCGIEFAFFSGRFWRTPTPLDDGSGNPPPGWGNPTQPGTMTIERDGTATFRGDNGKTLSFVPDEDPEIPICG